MTPEATENFQTNLASASPLLHYNSAHQEARQLPSSKSPGAYLRRIVIPTQFSSERLKSGSRSLRRAVSADRSQQAGQTSCREAEERDHSPRGARTRHCKPQPPGRSTASFPTAPRRPGGAAAVHGPTRLGWGRVGGTRAAAPSQPFSFPDSRNNRVLPPWDLRLCAETPSVPDL